MQYYKFGLECDGRMLLNGSVTKKDLDRIDSDPKLLQRPQRWRVRKEKKSEPLSSHEKSGFETRQEVYDYFLQLLKECENDQGLASIDNCIHFRVVTTQKKNKLSMACC